MIKFEALNNIAFNFLRLKRAKIINGLTKTNRKCTRVIGGAVKQIQLPADAEAALGRGGTLALPSRARGHHFRGLVRCAVKHRRVSLLALLGLGFGFSGLDGSLLLGGLGLGAAEELELALLVDRDDLLLRLHVVKERAGNGTANLELLNQGGAGDAEDLRALLAHALVLALVEEDGVVHLFLDLDLGPGLLLALSFGSLLL